MRRAVLTGGGLTGGTFMFQAFNPATPLRLVVYGMLTIAVVLIAGALHDRLRE
jgi:hypothetical protein